MINVYLFSITSFLNNYKMIWIQILLKCQKKNKLKNDKTIYKNHNIFPSIIFNNARLGMVSYNYFNICIDL